jgi:hypothetical protein
MTTVIIKFFITPIIYVKKLEIKVEKKLSFFDSKRCLPNTTALYGLTLEINIAIHKLVTKVKKNGNGHVLA